MSQTIRYTIAMPQPHTHLFEVKVALSGLNTPTLQLALPVWTPGSYMVREYARHVQEFRAISDGRPLPWCKIDKSTWQIETDGVAQLTVGYKVYANELTVRTSHLDGTHGYFNPATLCMYVPGRLNEPLGVDVILPPGWQVTTGLEPALAPVANMARSGMSVRSFVARDYDELIDSPFECGTHRLLSFLVDGIPHHIALWGRGNEDEGRLIEDTRRIVEATRDLFGGLPYREYTFIVHLADARGGGLEHRNSVSMLVERWTFQPRKAYERYLGLTAHEFFHVWNVKRIRAAPLGPFDYSRENYTRQLWAMEGVTDYYTDRLLLRAGLISVERYHELLAEKILSLQGQPGRALQSLEQSSFDTWIKLYRPDENSPNSAISYYLKGSLVALLLDLEIRHRTDGARSLDDVLRYLYRTYPIDGPGIPEEGGYRAAVEAVVAEGGASVEAISFADFFARYISGIDELDYERVFDYVGLRLSWAYQKMPEQGQTPPWLGIKLKTEQGRVKVSQVLSNGPALEVYANDELLALDGFRVDEERLSARLAERNPGERVILSLFRRDELLHIPVTLAPAPYDKLTLTQVEQPTARQQRLYDGWISFDA